MAGEDIIMAHQGELKRLHVVQKVLERVLKQVEAAEMLSLSARQMGRIVKRIRIEGDKGIIHRSRGKPSNRRIPKKMRDKVMGLYRKQYEGFGPTLACEKLLERDRIKLSDETLRRWLLETGDWKRIRKGRRHRQWRERTLRNDFTVAHNHKLYQVEDKIRGNKVMVQEKLDGSVVMTYRGQRLRFREITTQPAKPQAELPVMVRIRKPPTPPSDHPWRRFKFGIHRYERGRPTQPKT